MTGKPEPGAHPNGSWGTTAGQSPASHPAAKPRGESCEFFALALVTPCSLVSAPPPFFLPSSSSNSLQPRLSSTAGFFFHRVLLTPCSLRSALPPDLYLSTALPKSRSSMWHEVSTTTR